MLLDDKRREESAFEGAQGALLDIDHGTYPCHRRIRLPPRLRPVQASARRYDYGDLQGLHDRVGLGPSDRSDGQRDRENAGRARFEFGTVTGRARRCGWFDAVLVRQTVRTCGIDGLALTKLDILDGFDEVKVCVRYRLDGREIDYLPAGEQAQVRAEPVYETIEGWKQRTARARSWAQLRAQAIK